MATGEFEEGTTPAIREAPGEHPCPFCGNHSLLISHGDLENDNYRVELYCNNSFCDSREFMVIGKRMNGSVSDHRADVAAIEAVSSSGRSGNARKSWLTCSRRRAKRKATWAAPRE